ncbi:MAG: hypothetical protein KH452_05550 [Clostridiales bacterium]|nr:hypothetical protein [Clostridiales bacterium]
MQTYEGIIIKAIQELEGGDISALRTVYSAFAQKKPELMIRAASAIRKTLEGCPVSQMVKLYELSIPTVIFDRGA